MEGKWFDAVMQALPTDWNGFCRDGLEWRFLAAHETKVRKYRNQLTQKLR